MLPRSPTACLISPRPDLSLSMTDFEALRLPALTGVDQAVHQYEECGIIDGISHDSICSAPLLKVRDEMPVAACPLRTEHDFKCQDAKAHAHQHFCSRLHISSVPYAAF
jgi:hypothetical protein